jgi:hypothetical protein
VTATGRTANWLLSRTKSSYITREVFDEGDVEAVDRYLAPDFHRALGGVGVVEDRATRARSLRVQNARANMRMRDLTGAYCV